MPGIGDLTGTQPLVALNALAEFLAAMPFAGALRGSATLYALVNAAHILGIGLILGAILPLDLCLMGVLRGPALSQVGRFLSRVAATGVVIAALTGVMLISVRPGEYLYNPALWAKFALIALALVNVGVVHASPGWRAALSDRPVSTGLRFGAAISAISWLGALIAGRMIGFL